MELRFKDGDYASQQGYGANGVRLFTINWPLERGAGLTVDSALPGIARRSMPTTDYGDAREACRRLMAAWLKKVMGIEETVIITYMKG